MSGIAAVLHFSERVIPDEFNRAPGGSAGAGARAALAGGIRLEARLHCIGMDATGSSAGLSLLTPPQGGAALLEVGYGNGQLYAAHPHVCESCPPHTPVRQTAPVSLGPGGALEALVDARSRR